MMRSLICARGHAPVDSHLTTQQISDHLEYLRAQMALFVPAAAGASGEPEGMRDLSQRIGLLEHALVGRLIRAEQVALARLREETRQPLMHPSAERIFETMPEDITRRHVLPFVDEQDFANLAEASSLGIGAAVGLEIETMLEELRDLGRDHPVIASFFPTTLAAPESESAGQKMQKLMTELVQVKRLIMGETNIMPWVSLYEGLKQGASTRLSRLLHREAVLALAYVFNFGPSHNDRVLLRDKREIVHEAVQRNVAALRWADPRLRADREIVLAAVRWNGAALQFAAPALQKDKEIVLAAVRQYRLALQFADQELRTDPDLMRAAEPFLPRF